MYLKEYKPDYNKSTYTSTFVTALFTIAKLWKQPRCPRTDEWLKKVWYLYVIKIYSAIKKNEFCCSQVNGWDGMGGQHLK
jgi:hypothetical protein